MRTCLCGPVHWLSRGVPSLHTEEEPLLMFQVVYSSFHMICCSFFVSLMSSGTYHFWQICFKGQTLIQEGVSQQTKFKERSSSSSSSPRSSSSSSSSSPSSILIIDIIIIIIIITTILIIIIIIILIIIITTFWYQTPHQREALPASSVSFKELHNIVCCNLGPYNLSQSLHWRLHPHLKLWQSSHGSYVKVMH